MRFFLQCLLFSSLLVLFSDCGKDEESSTATVLVRISHFAGGQPLVANQLIFKDSANQSFSVEKLDYYLSNIKLRNKETGDFYYEVNSYHLVRAMNNTSNWEIILKNVPKKRFSELELSIGVDNGANHSTDRIGDLDPSNFMAWAWTTGYKFLAINGKYKVPSDSGNYLYHVGEDANFRTLKFSFKDLLGTNFEIIKDGQIIIYADVASLFQSPNPINFKEFKYSMAITEGSDKIADNYASGFLRLVGAN